MKKKTGYDNISKVLKNHLAHCKMHEFSLQEDRHCTCGVKEARLELSGLIIVWDKHWEDLRKLISEQE